MGHQVGSKMCPFCHRLEDHEHLLLYLTPLERCLVWCTRRGVNIEPSRLLYMLMSPCCVTARLGVQGGLLIIRHHIRRGAHGHSQARCG